VIDLTDLDPPYGTIVLDPPWDHGVTQRLGGKGRRTTAHGGYARLTPDAIAQIDLRAIAAPAAHLYVWVTSAVLLSGFSARIREAWDFEPVSLITWTKAGSRIGLGKYYRSDTEHVIFARRGTGTVPEHPWPSTTITAPRGRHSVKPDVFGDMVEQVSPGPYLEMFARTPRLGWSHHGAGFELAERGVR
jgi:N6-adenosine-specific RNA methylase IME4